MRRHVTFGVIASACGLLAVLALASYVFTGRNGFDDEGYILISLRGWTSGHALYSDVYTQYGPAFFVLIGGPLRLLGNSSISIEAARLATLILGLATAGILGFVTARISGSRYAGLFAGVIVASCSAAGLESALHPTHVVQLLIACTVAAVVVLEERPGARSPAIAAGVGIALCLLVKVNAGGVMLAAVAVGAGLTARTRHAAARLVAPVLLIAAVAAVASRSGYSSMFLVLLTAAGLVVLVGVRGTGPGGALEPKVVGTATLFTGIVVVAIALLTGSSLSVLVRGTIIDATRLANAFTVPMAGGRYTAVPLLLIAIAAWFVNRNETSAISGGVLIVMGFSVAAAAYAQRFSIGTIYGVNTLVLGAATSWTVVSRGERRFGSSRLVVTALALLLPLVVYPVAGGQRTAAALLFPVVGAIAVVRGGRLLADAGVMQFERVVPVLFSAAALAVGGVVFIRSAKTRADSVAIPFTGNLARTSPEDARDIVGVVAALDQCHTFYSLPGLASFYLFADKQPPTWQNAGAWTNLFDADRQRRVVGDLERVRGLCVIRNRTEEAFWLSSGKEQAGPLRPFLESKTVPVATVGDYEIYR
ncbi:MAG: hypothetical protein H0U92_08095 [Actinobacteria bacterium]|nr:hypothetical protein [Actinomycetota bacterium]